ncbi:MAG: hypothetical protein A2Y25_09755 [Candidatus Melainabacteria bacterium GWF2_37_15]|nr:MAG: hypothetical protein A2Y25_09755 [Candidatus Melainabacteria bacterium GWF2_37_15]
MLNSINGSNRTPVFKAIVIPKTDRHAIAQAFYAQKIQMIDSTTIKHKGVPFEILEGEDYKYRDPKKVTEKVFENIKDQIIIRATKNASTSASIFSQKTSVPAVERSLRTALSANNSMDVDDNFIIDK